MALTKRGLRLAALLSAVAAVAVGACTPLNKPPLGGAGAGGSAMPGGGPGGSGASGGAGTTGAAGQGGAGGASGAGGGPTLPAALLSIDASTRDYSVVVVGNSVDIGVDVTNKGGMDSGLLAASLTGANAGQFSLAQNNCVAGLPAMGHCTVTVRFQPTTDGAKSATLVVTANPGGMVSVNLTGKGALPGILSISPAIPPAFAPLGPGGVSAPLQLTVQNTGDTATGSLQVSVSDLQNFGLVDNCSGNPLLGHGSCLLTVTFKPQAPGSKSATLSVSATPGGTASVGLNGMGLRPAQLSADAFNALGTVEVGIASTPPRWTIQNVGDVPTGTLTLANQDPAEIGVTSNGCTGTLAANASCDIVVTFKAAASGSLSGGLTLSATPGGSVSYALSATGAYRLTVVTQGTGSVTSSPAGISCGATCSALFTVPVNLNAVVSNGSGFRFGGWTGGGCSGVARNCSVTLGASATVTATFTAIANNLVFFTSAAFPTNLGSAAAYDSKCNAAATAAGINDSTGTSFAAFLADNTSLPATRLQGARGWVRMDGKPFADMLSNLLSANQAYNASLFDENGGLASNFALTGTNSDGSLSPDTCTNWTGVGSMVQAGQAVYGPEFWNSNAFLACSQTGSLVCMGKTRTAAVAPVVVTGRKLWITNTPFTPGTGQAPDALCQAQRPSGVTTAVALIARTDRAASALLSPTTNYVRPDGTLVGTGAELVSVTSNNGTVLESGPWQQADGTYNNGAAIWAGTGDITTVGTTVSTCGNWTDPTQTTGLAGIPQAVSATWWGRGTASCSSAFWLYCLQTN